MNPADFDNTCYIVGGGSSLRNFDWTDLDGKFVIAINRAYEVLPNAQVLYFTDVDYWQVHKDKMLAHTGKKIKGTIAKQWVKHPDVEEYLLSGPHGLDKAPKQLKHGYNSTYAAINLAAVHLGFKTIYLMGIDMKWGIEGNKSTSHWHNGHKRVDHENVYNRMKAAYDTIHQPLSDMGVKVINITRDSSLTVFKKVDFTDVFGDKYTRRVMGVVKGEEKLLGDHVEAALEKIGAKHVQKVIERVTRKPCNCGQRKKWMNKLHQRAKELCDKK